MRVVFVVCLCVCFCLFVFSSSEYSVLKKFLVVDTKYRLHQQERLYLLQFLDNRLVQSTFRVAWHAVLGCVHPVWQPAARDIVPSLGAKLLL